MLNTIGAPDFDDVESLAGSVKLSEKLIYYLANDYLEGRYRDFTVPKRSGGERMVSAPCSSLKTLQRWVLEEILYKVKVSPYSYGFEKARNSSDKNNSNPILHLADRHCKQLFILKMDLKDFYPSIERKRVFAQFLKIGYGSYAADLLTEICTHNGSLPQGGVTSAYLANIICYHMDMRIAGYCNKRGIVYTRYADDIIFSSDDRGALRGIYGAVRSIIEEEGFTVNDRKTRFLTPKGRKEVLGLILVNEPERDKILAPRDLKRMVRTMIHHQIITGDYSEYSKVLGYISYIDSIERGYKEKIKKYIEKFQKDRITMFDDAVVAFNEHRYFKDIPELEVHEPHELFTDKNDDPEDIASDCYEEREEFVRASKKKINRR